MGALTCPYRKLISFSFHRGAAKLNANLIRSSPTVLRSIAFFRANGDAGSTFRIQRKNAVTGVLNAVNVTCRSESRQRVEQTTRSAFGCHVKASCRTSTRTRAFQGAGDLLVPGFRIFRYN